jgi:hypothetical protein
MNEHEARDYMSENQRKYAETGDAWYDYLARSTSHLFDIPLASEAMAERDENGEVKGLMF